MCVKDKRSLNEVNIDGGGEADALTTLLKEYHNQLICRNTSRSGYEPLYIAL